jgi:hypothetical protein
MMYLQCSTFVLFVTTLYVFMLLSFVLALSCVLYQFVSTDYPENAVYYGGIHG